MLNKKPVRNRAIISTLYFFVFLTACSDKQDASKTYQSAIESLENGRTSAAIIELKNTLKLDPGFVAARKALGDIYFNEGQFFAAWKEYTHSLDQTEPSGSIHLRLAEIEILNGTPKQAKRWTQVTSVQSEETQANLKALEAISLMLQNHTQEAEIALEVASKYSPDAAFVRAAKAEKAIRSNTPTAAAEDLRNLPNTLKSPYIEALKGKAALAQNDTRTAIALFEKLVLDYRGHSLFKLQLAQLYMVSQQVEKAAPLIKELLTKYPEQPLTNYLQAELDAQAKDFNSAQLHAEKALTGAPNNDNARLLAGLAAYKLKRYEQSYDHLIPLENKLSPTSPALRALIDLQLRLGRMESLQSNLKPLQPQDANDLALLQIATQKLAQSGKIESARTVARQTWEKAPEITASQALLGQLELINSPLDGQKRLEDAIRKDVDLIAARVNLAKQYIQSGDYQRALTLAEDWITLKPKQPQGFLLKALVQSSSPGGEIGAIEAYTQALDRAPKNLAAILGLARLHARSGEQAKAFEYINTALSLAPDQTAPIQALLELTNQGQQARQQINDDQFVNALDKAQQNSKTPNDAKWITARATLLVLLGKKGEAKQVIESTQTQQRTPAQLLLLGDLLLAEGKLKEAQQTYTSGLNKHPQNLALQMRSIGSLEAMGQIESALRTALDGLRHAPTNAPLSIATANLYFLTNQPEAAIDILSHPDPATLENIPLYWKLKGQLAMLQGDYAAGTSHLLRYKRINPTKESTRLLAAAYQTATQFDAAEKALLELGDDPDALLQRGSLLTVQKRDQDAALIYQQVIQRFPHSPVALNNLAGIYLRQNAPQKALALLEPNLKHIPPHPAFLDTYGRALLDSGRYQEALTPLETAWKAVPTNQIIATNYALALEKNGSVSEATEVRKNIE